MRTVGEEILDWRHAVVDHQAEHARFPDFVGECGRNPLLAHGFVWRSGAWKGECGVCQSSVFDACAPGHLVANPVWVFVGEEGGEVDGLRSRGDGIAGLDCEAFGFEAVGVANWRG